MVTRHACALVKTGRDTWACRLVRGSLCPHAPNKTPAAYAVNAFSDDQHRTRNEQQGEDDFSEHGFVNSSKKSKAQPCSSQEERQTDHE